MRNHIVPALACLLLATTAIRAQDVLAADSEVRVRRSPASSRVRAPRVDKARASLDPVAAGDDETFRPTVVIRRGTSQGSGTIVASIDGDTLVLTASHVVQAEGPILVELHRYNLGLERRADAPGQWPRRISAELVGDDAAGDVAIVRVRKMVALPYVARLSDEDQDALPADAVLTSVGIDLGTKLSSWKTELVETASFQLNESQVERPFLITARTPEHGRSGGGLFTDRGRLVGVCIGHAEIIQGRRMGVFASIDSVHRILHEHDLADVVDRSKAHRAKLRRPASSVTPTRSRAPAPTRR